MSRGARIVVTGPDRGGNAAWLMTRLALLRAGAEAVRATPSDPVGGAFDGLVLGGGADVDPDLYSETASSLGEVSEAAASADRADGALWRTSLYAPAIRLLRRALARPPDGNGRLDLARDRLERTLLAEAVRRDLPVLGICRGAQLLNVHFGGTLFAELDSFHEETRAMRTVLPRKRVAIEPRSRLATVLGTTVCRVNALHRQAIRTLGAGLSVVARESNGVVQAVEQSNHPFRIGVQWHPELLPQDRRQVRLFTGLVDVAACRG